MADVDPAYHRAPCLPGVVIPADRLDSLNAGRWTHPQASDRDEEEADYAAFVRTRYAHDRHRGIAP